MKAASTKSSDEGECGTSHGGLNCTVSGYITFHVRTESRGSSVSTKLLAEGAVEERPGWTEPSACAMDAPLIWWSVSEWTCSEPSFHVHIIISCKQIQNSDAAGGSSQEEHPIGLSAPPPHRLCLDEQVLRSPDHQGPISRRCEGAPDVAGVAPRQDKVLRSC